MLLIDPGSPTPLIDQVRDGIRHAVARGELTTGDPLPSIRQLAGDLGMHPNTIARAYQLLEQDGLVVTQRGRGTVVRADHDRVGGSAAESALRQRLAQVLSDAKLAGFAADHCVAWMDQLIPTLWPSRS